MVYTFPKYIVPVHLFVVVQSICMCNMYMSEGGGRTSTYFPAEELRVDVLSVQCVASTCVRVGMG
jgi:hypothetical protein